MRESFLFDYENQSVWYKKLKSQVQQNRDLVSSQNWENSKKFEKIILGIEVPQLGINCSSMKQGVILIWVGYGEGEIFSNGQN